MENTIELISTHRPTGEMSYTQSKTRRSTIASMAFLCRTTHHRYCDLEVKGKKDFEALKMVSYQYSAETIRPGCCAVSDTIHHAMYIVTSK